MLKVAFVGCAHIHTPGFIRMLSERKDVEIAGVWDHDEVRAAKNAEATHSRVLPLEAILDDSSITTVIICSETPVNGRRYEIKSKKLLDEPEGEPPRG